MVMIFHHKALGYDSTVEHPNPVGRDAGPPDLCARRSRWSRLSGAARSLAPSSVGRWTLNVRRSMFAFSKPSAPPPNRPTAQPLTVHRSLSTAHSPSRGFTLVELLTVILIMAILLGLMSQAAQIVIRVAREKRLAITCRTLETAMARYRDEYGAWPIPRSPNTFDGDYDPDYLSTNFIYTVSGEDNKKWFTLLRATTANDFNPKKIPFVDETTIFTVISQSGNPLPVRTPLHVARAKSGHENDEFPFVGVNRRGDTVYFNIEIDVDKDTVEVGY